LDSVTFTTFIHADTPRVSCPDHGVEEALIPRAEMSSRFTREFAKIPIRMLQNLDTFNFTEIKKLSWKQAWNIL